MMADDDTSAMSTAELLQKVVVSETPPDDPEAIWIRPFSFVEYDEAYRAAMRETLAKWEAARLETVAGQYERFTEATAELLRLMFEPLRRWLEEELRPQIRDFFTLMADAAEALNEFAEHLKKRED